ncbi:MAG: siphovirus ReqiPepy6 Gp37-like family protein, partial [Bacillus sp. (in: Bacteria)]|nr:siphovirus ReqiPepy6 Gp37-like family protein [Bacillus sp. (in: firmicutes)]
MYTTKKPIVEIYDRLFNRIEFTDDFISLIWTDRYNDVGEFELVLPITENMTNIYKNGYFVKRNDRENVCYIESIEKKYESSSGPQIKITGKDSINIANQRIIYNSHQYNKEASEIVREIFQDNLSYPSDTLREIHQIHGLFMTDEAESALLPKIEIETNHDPLLDKILEILKQFNVGLRSYLYSGPTAALDKVIVFEAFSGTDRSKVQKSNPRIIFSPKFDNLKSTTFLRNIAEFKNMAYSEGKYEIAVKTSPETYEIMEVSMFGEAGYGKGLGRFEEYVDSTSVDKNVNGVELTNDEFRQVLKQKGIDDLVEKSEIYLLDSEVYANNYEYYKDYFIGDIVSIDDE